MNVLHIALRELIGMFIDDGALALFAMVLIAVIAAAVEFAGLPGFIGGILLLIGCIAILAESTYRAVRKKIDE